MGHKEGEGLGKHSQGRKQIVEASTQRGRRGLGMVVAGLEPKNLDWDFDKEKVSSEIFTLFLYFFSQLSICTIIHHFISILNDNCIASPQNKTYCGRRLLGKMLFSSRKLEIFNI